MTATSVGLLSVALATSSGAEVAPADPPYLAQPIRQIDHIMIRSGRPQDLFAFFTDTLDLPVAWPLTSPRAGVVTGGVGLGNVSVEAIQFPGQTDASHRLVGFAIEPTGLDGALLELKRREIALGERRSVIALDGGSTKLMWTNVTLLQFSDADDPANAGSHVFLSEYSPSYLDVEGRRSRLRKELSDADGGPLGIIAVKEVIVGATDLEASRRLWQRLLDPIPAGASNRWQIGDGPAVLLVPAPENCVQTLVVQVASLDRAKAFLEEKHLLGAESEGGLTIDRAKIGGLDILLVVE